MARLGCTCLHHVPEEWACFISGDTMDLNRLAELENQRRAIVDELATINAQLSQTRRFEGGRMLMRSEYSQWRNKATLAKMHKERALRDLNFEIKQLRRERNERVIAARGVDVKDPDTLIAHAYALLHRLAAEGVELDAQEQAVVDGLRHHLQHVPAGGEGA